MSHIHTVIGKGKIVCPRCGDLASRVKRRPYDRIVSLLKSVKRYRCDFCDWTGTVFQSDSKDR